MWRKKGPGVAYAFLCALLVALGMVVALLLLETTTYWDMPLMLSERGRGLVFGFFFLFGGYMLLVGIALCARCAYVRASLEFCLSDIASLEACRKELS